MRPRFEAAVSRKPTRPRPDNPAKLLGLKTMGAGAVQAFVLLKQLSQRSNNRLVEVAQGLVDAEFPRTNFDFWLGRRGEPA